MPGMLVPVAGGAKAGSVAVSGASNVAQEKGSESPGGAAKRTAFAVYKSKENALTPLNLFRS